MEPGHPCQWYSTPKNIRFSHTLTRSYTKALKSTGWALGRSTLFVVPGGLTQDSRSPTFWDVSTPLKRTFLMKNPGLSWPRHLHSRYTCFHSEQ